MSDVGFWLSYTMLWALVLLLLASVFFLYRHHGRMLLDSRAGRADQGPDTEKPLPGVRARDRDGRAFELGQPSPLPRLLFFAQTSCKACEALLPALATFADQHVQALETVLICAGRPRDIDALAADLPAAVHVVPDLRSELLANLRVSSTPLALVLDREGTVRGKVMPGSAEAFTWLVESLESSPPVATHPGFVPIESLRSRA